MPVVEACVSTVIAIVSSDSPTAAYIAAVNLQCVHSVTALCKHNVGTCVCTAQLDAIAAMWWQVLDANFLFAYVVQIAVRAEVHLLPAPQRQEVLQSLLQHTLECFTKTLAVQLPDISTGGLLQLLLELQYLHAALAAYISARLEQTFVKLGAVLTERIQQKQEQEQQAEAEQLNVWLSQAQGSDMMECMQARLAQVLSLSTAGQQHNLCAMRT